MARSSLTHADRLAGTLIEGAMGAHHRRRLRNLGHAASYDPPADARLWAAGAPPPPGRALPPAGGAPPGAPRRPAAARRQRARRADRWRAGAARDRRRDPRRAP